MHMSTSTSLLGRFVQILFASIESWTHSQRPRTIESLLRAPLLARCMDPFNAPHCFNMMTSQASYPNNDWNMGDT